MNKMKNRGGHPHLYSKKLYFYDDLHNGLCLKLLGK